MSNLPYGANDSCRFSFLKVIELLISSEIDQIRPFFSKYFSSIVGGNPAKQIGLSVDFAAKWRNRQEAFGYTSQDNKQSTLVMAMQGGQL